MGWLHWLAHSLAFDSTTDDAYAANSGTLGYLIPPILDFVAFYSVYRYHNACAVKGCIRRARHDADGHKICHHHAGRHKQLSLEHLAHFHRTGVMPTPPPEHVDQGEHQ